MRKKIRPTTAERNERLRNDYDRLHRRGFRHDKILDELAGKYCLAPRTVAMIVCFDYERDLERTIRKDGDRPPPGIQQTLF